MGSSYLTLRYAGPLWSLRTRTRPRSSSPRSLRTPFRAERCIGLKGRKKNQFWPSNYSCQNGKPDVDRFSETRVHFERWKIVRVMACNEVLITYTDRGRRHLFLRSLAREQSRGRPSGASSAPLFSFFVTLFTLHQPHMRIGAR